MELVFKVRTYNKSELIINHALFYNKSELMINHALFGHWWKKNLNLNWFEPLIYYG